DDGIFIGAFTNNYAYTLGIRKGTNARAIYSKGAVATGTQFAGAGGIDSTIEMGTPLHITITPTTDGKTRITYENLETGKTEAVESSVQADVAGRYYGMVVSDANVTITNMLYKAPDGTVHYDQNACYYPMGSTPTASDVAAVAAESREYIDVTWDGTVPENDGTYVVEMSKDNGEWVELSDDVVGFSYRYEIPAGDGGNYLFRVCGQLGKETLGGDRTAYATMAESIYVKGALERPVVEILAGASSISLDWQDVAEAEYYLVYRYSFDEGAEASAQIAKVTGSEYIDSTVTAEMPYYYNVIAISEATDNQSTLSDTVWQVATPGHTGEYVYEDEATKITLTKKSYDTVYSSEVVLEGVVDNAGTLEAYVNGVVADSKELGVRESFAFNLTVSEGRNDVELIFTDAEGKKTRQVYNFVYLTNYDAVVDAAYTGTDGEAAEGIPTYRTVQAAVDAMAANAETDRVILVKAGSYEERLVVNTPNISIIGEDRESTNIHFFPGNHGEMDKRCATYIQSGAKGFSAENITFANDCVYAEYPNQQDALRCDADKASFVNVKFVGVQDTLYMHTGYQYYDKCRIEGLIDFIYSGEGARAFFNDCEIVFVYESTKTSGYTAAPKTAENATYGLTFNNCVITSEEGCLGTEYLLARPWGKDAYITWINCFMGKSINSVLPYKAMSGNAYEEARFFEFGTYGPGFAINADRRQISPAKAAEMVTDAYLGWAPLSVSDAIAAKYIGTITTTDAPSFVEKEYNADTYAWTDGDDTDLKLYDMEGYAEGYGVTGGGLLKETNSNYYQVATAKEFLEALIAVKTSGKASVIEMTADINLGCNEVEDFKKYSDMKLLTAYSAQALTHPTLIESGVSKLNLESINNLTIFSLNGSSIKHANITMKKSNNIMIRNIKFDELWEWDEATNGDYDRNDWDYMTIDESCNGIWIDHCTFYKAYDGIVDIKNPNPENNVTISWCEFLPGSENNEFFDVMMNDIFANPSNYATYMKMLGAGMTQDQIYMYAYGQKKTHLLGQSDEATNAAGIRLTMANNYYLNSMDRMPRLRYGNAHVYNCIMDAQELLDVRLSIQNEDYAKKIVSNGAASTCGAQVLLENCYISGIQNALNSGNGSSPSGYINAVDSVYYMNGELTNLAPKCNSTGDTRVLVTDADAFVANLPYSGYHLYNADDLDEIILPRVGAGKINLTVLQWEKVSYNATYEEPTVFRAEISTTIPESVMTDEIKAATGCETVEELVRYLQTNVIDNELAKELLPNAKTENSSVMEIVVQISTDGGKTWVNATPDNFPMEGVDVVIPYPEGTNSAEYSFVIGHLITMGCNGMKVGDMEFFNPQEIGKGLQIHIMSASPFVVAWEKDGEQPPVDPNQPVTPPVNPDTPNTPDEPNTPDTPEEDDSDNDDSDDDDSAYLPESQGTTSPKTYDDSAYVPMMVPQYTEDGVEELPTDVVVVAAPAPDATSNNYWIMIAIIVAAIGVIVSRIAMFRKEEEE
ncbi:MAG: hypothetical protein IJF07_07025, partial [Lachnospiraceae bacterium]|nr:hypothetical protein [Lachnospiraceae bacterium]